MIRRLLAAVTVSAAVLLAPSVASAMGPTTGPVPVLLGADSGVALSGDQAGSAPVDPVPTDRSATDPAPAPEDSAGWSGAIWILAVVTVLGVGGGVVLLLVRRRHQH